jgi:hypothetical protein
MGWISDLLGFGGDDNDTSGTQTIVQRNEIPPYLTEFSKEQLGFAKELAQTPFAPAPGGLVAPFSADQQAAFQAARANQGIADPYFAAAGSTMADVAGADFRTADIAGYSNPYLDPMRETINRSYDVAQTQADARAVQAGAFGGSRRGIYDAELQGQRGRALGDLERQAYDKAQQAYRDDQKAQLAGGMALQGLGTEVQAARGRDVGQLALYGGQQQQLAQATADVNYDQFMREYEHPFQMFNVRQSALSGLPYSQTTARDTTAPTGNVLAQNLGAAANVVGGIGNFFAAPGGGGQSAAQGLGSAWGGFTDWWKQA